MAGRAKENLPLASLKYLFVYLKIRIFKCSYRITTCNRWLKQVSHVLWRMMDVGTQRSMLSASSCPASSLFALFVVGRAKCVTSACLGTMP